MNPIRSILAIVDPTGTEHPAVAKAARLAQRFEARLELFLCDTKAARDIRYAAYAESKCDAPLIIDTKEILEGMAEPLRRAGLDVTTEVARADPLHIALVERAKHTCAELVVKDTHHHTLAQRTLLTNTDWELIRGCPAPLLLTKARPWADAPRICAAVDPGHHDDKPALLDRYIVEMAAEVARRLGGELHVLHAYIPAAMVAAATASATAMTYDINPEVLAVERERQMKQLLALVADYRVPGGNIHLEVGSVGHCLCQLCASLNADVVTLGAVSRRSLKRLFIGSTAEQVLERLPCDALIVKGPNFAEALVL